MPLPPADPVFGSVFRGKKADVNLYLRKVATQEAVHPQHVYVMIAGEVVPAGPKPEIDLLYDEMKGKGVFEGVEGDTQPANTEYSGYRQSDVVDPDSQLPITVGSTHRQSVHFTILHQRDIQCLPAQGTMIF